MFVAIQHCNLFFPKPDDKALSNEALEDII